MNHSATRRISLFIAVIASLTLLFFAFNLLRFSSDRFLAAALNGADAEAFIEGAQRQRFGTTLTWTSPTLETNDILFSADYVTARFNLLSVAIGRPSLQIISIESPYLEVAEGLNEQAALRQLLKFNFQQLNATNGLIVSGDAEIQDLELSLLRNGVFGEYAVQSSGEWVDDSNIIRLSFSTLVGIDGDNHIVFGKSQVDANVTVPNWTGRFAGKIKTVRLTEANELTLKFVNWSSNWKTNLPMLNTTLDWAGGLTEGQFNGVDWSLNTLDTAIAYRDTNDIAHTFAVQSNESNVVDGKLSGQLGASLLTEFPDTTPFQSFNFVLSGQLDPSINGLAWESTDMRFSLIDQINAQQTHYFTASQFAIDPEQQVWTLTDGEWRHVVAESQIADYGFSTVTGEFPSLVITSPPFLTEKLQPAFDLLAPDIETLNALFDHLVP